VTSVGYAWLPLLNKGRLNIEEQSLAVACQLPSGYLSIQPLGLGKGVSNRLVNLLKNFNLKLTKFNNVVSLV
jgi:hypothetical protein